jgi:hypothetical protein
LASRTLVGISELFRDLELDSDFELLLPPPSRLKKLVKMKYIHSEESLNIPEGGEYNCLPSAVEIGL